MMAFEIAALRDLKVFDLEGTEIMHLPIEIGEPTRLRCFRASLYAGANRYSNVTKQNVLRKTETKLSLV